jgi:multidrug efflux pump subunit AcrA (membrane-fusion protein)
LSRPSKTKSAKPAAKEKKPAKERPVKDRKAAKEGTEHKGGSGFLTFVGVFLFFVLLTTVGLAVIYFNAGIKEHVNNFLNFTEIPLQQKEIVLQDRENKLDNRAMEQVLRENELSILEADIAVREAVLAAKEQNLTLLEAQYRELIGRLIPKVDELEVRVSDFERLTVARRVQLINALVESNQREYVLLLLTQVRPRVRIEVLENMGADAEWIWIALRPMIEDED